ncbi:hypothetical protein BSZ35_16285 [Salinibacter sp. 10B]|nr:hypothetical protein BSZ35_16285 [Salinibacter sp. 10B]
MFFIGVGLVGIGSVCLSLAGSPGAVHDAISSCCGEQVGQEAACTVASECQGEEAVVSHSSAILTNSSCGVKADRSAPAFGADAPSAHIKAKKRALGVIRSFFSLGWTTAFSPPVSLHLLYEVFLD